jgi:hypothetical protein
LVDDMELGDRPLSVPGTRAADGFGPSARNGNEVTCCQ